MELSDIVNELEIGVRESEDNQQVFTRKKEFWEWSPSGVGLLGLISNYGSVLFEMPIKHPKEWLEFIGNQRWRHKLGSISV